jgi:hypothetical protein
VSATETLLYLVGVPAAVAAVVWALVYRGGPAAQKRYRPNRPYRFAPVWYVANRSREPDPGVAALEAGQRRATLPASRSQPSVGGASDRW